MNTPFVEQDCTIQFQGKTFEAGGAIIAPCKGGRWRGMVYVNEEKHEVQTWHGQRIASCTWTDYRGNFCKMRRVSFSLDGRRYVGDYCPDWADVCKVRSTK